MMEVSNEAPKHNVGGYRHLKRLKYHTKPITSMAIDHHGEVIATTGLDEYIHLFDAVSGTHRSKVACKKYGADLIKFGGTGADEAVLASVNGWNDSIRLISLEKNSYLRYYKGHRGRVHSIECSPVQKEIFASASDDATIKIWDFRTPSCQSSILQSSPSKIAFDALGLIIASIRLDPSTAFSTPFTPSTTSSSGSLREIRCLMDMLDSRMMDAGPFQSWLLPPFDFPISTPFSDTNAKDTSQQRKEPWSQGGVGTEYSKSSFSSSIATPSLFPFPLSTTTSSANTSTIPIATKNGSEPSISISSILASVQFSPNGSSLLLSTSGTDIMLIDAFTGDRLQLWQNRQNHLNHPLQASFHPDGDMIVTGSSNNNIHIYNSASGEQITVLAPIESQENSKSDFGLVLPHTSSSNNSSSHHTYRQPTSTNIPVSMFHPSLEMLISANGSHLDLFAQSS